MKKLIFCFLVLFLAGCHHLPGENGNTGSVTLANPASTFCVEQGGRVEIRDEEMGQVGYCVFPDGAEREEWEFFRASQVEDMPIVSEPVIPINCTSWFDGCNNCMVENGQAIACTRMFCPPETMQEPRCLNFVEKNYEEPLACTMEYMPVCGVDGVTYGNDCAAGKVEIAYEGECRE